MASTAYSHADLPAADAAPLAARAQLWRQVLVALEADPTISRASFSTWLRATQLLGLQGADYVVGAQHAFARDKLDRAFRPAVEAAVRHVTGRAEAGVRFVVVGRADGVRPATTHRDPPPGVPLATPVELPRARGGEPAAATPGPAVPGEATPDPIVAAAPVPAEPVQAEPASLDPRLTFASFVPGRAAQFACAAARAVAENPAMAYNPLFLYGPSGTGKTHLLHAIGNHVRSTRPTARVRYLTGQALAETVTRAAGSGTLDALRRTLARDDVLLLDDIQGLAGVPAAQRELLLLFNRLPAADGQLVLAADTAPRALTGLEERLRTRLLMGLVADVGVPDAETRLAILRRRTEALPVAVPPGVTELIAHRVTGTARELEGALTRVLAAADLARVPVSLELAARSLDGVGAPPRRARVLPEEVLAAVAESFGVTEHELAGSRRDKEIVVPRQVAMYLIRELANVSLAEIGAHLGGRDHSTVLHGCERVAALMAEDHRLRGHVEAITRRLPV